LLRAIRRAVDRRARVASICTGAFVLAATGALEGLRATTHWRGAAELARRYPTIDVDADVLYVDNGHVLTSAGAAAGFDLCLHLVRRDLGAETAAEVARAAVMPLERAGGQAQFIVHETPVDNHTSMGQLLTWMERNLRSSLSLPVIARHAAMSTRTLSRHFRAQIGTTPADWIARARIRRAQRLLETTELDRGKARRRSRVPFRGRDARAFRPDCRNHPACVSASVLPWKGNAVGLTHLQHAPTICLADVQEGAAGYVQDTWA